MHSQEQFLVVAFDSRRMPSVSSLFLAKIHNKQMEKEIRYKWQRSNFQNTHFSIHSLINQIVEEVAKLFAEN
jgi:hypothetical protein